MTRRAVTITITACATLATLATPALAATQAAHAPVEVRVNQVGYAPGAQKVAYAMLPAFALGAAGAHGHRDGPDAQAAWLG